MVISHLSAAYATALTKQVVGEYLACTTLESGHTRTPALRLAILPDVNRGYGACLHCIWTSPDAVGWNCNALIQKLT